MSQTIAQTLATATPPQTALRHIHIVDLSYRGKVDKNNVIVRSVETFGWLPGADPIIVAPSQILNKFDVEDGRKRVLGARLNKNIKTLPCLVVGNSQTKRHSPHHKETNLTAYIQPRINLYYFIIEILNFLHSEKNPPKNLPLKPAHFVLIRDLTAYSIKTIQRLLAIVRSIYKTIIAQDPNAGEHGIRALFDAVIKSGTYPELNSFCDGKLEAYTLETKFRSRKQNQATNNVSQADGENKSNKTIEIYNVESLESNSIKIVPEYDEIAGIKKEALEKLFAISSNDEFDNSLEEKIFNINQFFTENSLEKPRIYSLVKSIILHDPKFFKAFSSSALDKQQRKSASPQKNTKLEMKPQQGEKEDSMRPIFQLFKPTSQLK